MGAKLLLVLVGIAAIAGLAVLSLPAYEEEQSAAQVIKEHPRVQAFYKEHPDARFALQRFSKNQLEREEPRIAQECKEPLEPGKYYRAELESRDELNHLILWVDQNTYYAYCITDTPASDQPPLVTPVTPPKADENKTVTSDRNATGPLANTKPPTAPVEPVLVDGNAGADANDSKAHEPLPQITDVNAQPAEPEIQPTCTDTDGNVNYYEQGTLTWENATGNGTETDTCLNDTQLQEYYCKGSGVGKLSVTCPVGNTCQDGLCFPPPPDPPACNNNILDIGEECDMEQLGGQTCQTLGFASGTLTCNTECTFDTAACNNCGNGVCDAGENPDTCASDCTCGNGAINTNEQCDGEILPHTTCTQYNPQKYYAGEMTCTPQCTYDTTACQTWCGNGTCDVSRGETVTSCSTDCKCGNGIIDTGEQCEPKNMPPTLCAEYDPFYVLGNLSCNNQCQYDTSQCVSNCGNWVCDPGENANNCDHDCDPTCNNNVIEQGEQCDGTAVPITACAEYNPSIYNTGEMACTANCTYDTASCAGCGDGTCQASENANTCDADCDPVCNNGVIEQGEQCDGTALGGATCQSKGFDGGAISCTGSCTLNTNACYTCGDGTANPGEECDGRDFSGKSCGDYGFFSGNLSCTASCTVSTSNCNMCGNNVIDEGELCDGTSVITCSEYTYGGVHIFTGGNMVCGDCRYYKKDACYNDTPAPTPSCGDGKCEMDESVFSCPGDCRVHSVYTGWDTPVCGDGTRESGGEVLAGCDVETIDGTWCKDPDELASYEVWYGGDYVKGTCAGSNGTYEEFCGDSRKLYGYNCFVSGNAINGYYDARCRESIGYCPSGSTCVDGACVLQSCDEIYQPCPSGTACINGTCQ